MIIQEKSDYEFRNTKNSIEEKNNFTPVINKNKTVSIENIEIKKNMMPDLTNVSLRDAITILTKLGLKYKINGSGKVVSQSILPGNKIEKGKSCVLECREITVSGTAIY
jgi:cell division protein FtsI (penicillin-binding protein 3)